MIDDFADLNKKSTYFESDSLQKLNLPNGFDSMLVDFSILSGCPCLFVNYKNEYIYENDSEAGDFFVENLRKHFNDLFKELLQLNSSGENRFTEFTYNNSIRAVANPVQVEDKIFGFIVYGGFVLEKDEIATQKLDSKQYKIFDAFKVERNIDRASRFTEIISSQLNLSLNLNNQVEQTKQALNQLKIQKTFFENLFENSPEAIVILDNNDKVIKVNQEFENLFEYSSSEIEGKLINDLIVPENFKNEGEEATKDAVEGQLVDLITLRQTKFGKQIHVQTIGKPIMLGDDKLAVYAIYRNLTEQVWNQKSQNILYSISQTLNSAKNAVEIIKSIDQKLKSLVGQGEFFLELFAPNNKNFRFFSSHSNSFIEKSFSETLSYCIIEQPERTDISGHEVVEKVNEFNLNLEVIPKKWLGYPLMSNGELLGVFGVYSMSESANFNEKSIELLDVISEQLAADVAKKKHEQELNMLYRSMEQSPASVVITDLDGTIEYVNPKFTEISGYTFEEAIGKNPSILKSGYTSSDEYKNMWEKIERGEEWKGEFLNVKKDKDLYWEKAVISGIRDEYGKIVQYLAVKEDITVSKNYERELFEAKNMAEESDRMKSAFLANMSHELRTPLNAVIGFSNLCNESMSVKEIIEFVSLINKSGNQLLGIIEDILDFTLIENGALRIVEEEFLMVNFLEEIKKEAAEKRALKNKERLEFRFSPAQNFNKILVRTDFQRLLQVITNLIKNGLKFTNEGFVEFGYYVEDEILKLYVKDTGVGIEKAKKDIIFDRFRQVDDTMTRTFGGTGMGLTISKKIMDMLGGYIEVESEPNVGSKFTVSLDCILSKEENTNKQEKTKLVTSRKNEHTILVAEDEISNFRLIQVILKRNNYQVIRAKNGEEAINTCKKNNNIDLILMDIRMPGIDGMYATKEIKKIRPDLPIIAQTAYAMDGDKDKAIEQGCDDYISKPIKKELLLEKLKIFLK